jgi:hypothetical protein
MKEHDPKHVRGLAGIRVGAALVFLVGCVMVAGMLLSSPSARAAELHGIGFVKGCNSPTVVGQPYICTFSAINTVDTQHDTLTITSVVDVVHSGSGGLVPVTSGNLLLPPTVLTLGVGASCNPGQTLCTIPYGSSVTFTITFYSVQPGDPNPLTDTATLTFQDTCSPGTPTPNCPLGQTLYTQAASQSEVHTPTPTPTFTPTPTPTPTFTPTPTPTPTNTFTPTPTATPKPPGVGGVVKLPPAAVAAEYGAAADESGWTVWAYAAVASAVALVIMAVAAGGWYTRRRWLR